MKKIATLIAALPLCSIAFGQAITINATDIPVPGFTHCKDLSTLTMANPPAGPSQTWSYTGTTNDTFTNRFFAETNPVFTAAGVDVATATFKHITATLGYYLSSEIDFNSTCVQESGINVPEQHYDLSAVTTSTADSLIIPDQQIIIAAPKRIMTFPFTANSKWSSVSRTAVNYNLTVGAAMLDHTPGQHVYRAYRKDTIAGWGKMTVHTPTGNSIPYDVLMDKIIQYSTDSFYLGGAPMPAMLLTAFGIAQDQKTDYNTRINFYRKGSYNYLYSVYYDNDTTFTTPVSTFVHTDNLTTLGIDDASGNVTTVVFPNPTAGDYINIMVSGAKVEEGSYFITSATGGQLLAGNFSAKAGIITIPLYGQLVDGVYVLHLNDARSNAITTEVFSVRR